MRSCLWSFLAYIYPALCFYVCLTLNGDESLSESCFATNLTIGGYSPNFLVTSSVSFSIQFSVLMLKVSCHDPVVVVLLYDPFQIMLITMLCSTLITGVIMVRKRRTDLPSGGEGSDPQEHSAGSGRGSPRPADRGGPQHQGGGHHGGRGWVPQAQQGGYGGGRGRGTQQQQQYGGPSEYQPRGRGAPHQQGGRRGYGGRGPASGREGGLHGGVPRPLPELHQAIPAGVSVQPMFAEASSSSVPAEPSEVAEQFSQLSVQQEGSSSRAIQPVAPSSKAMKFPLRPGKGSTGVKCIVKANHFFAELPDKDLHQYDVRVLTHVFFI